MEKVTYISPIRRYRVVMSPTMKRIDGELVPSRVIEFENGTYTTEDSEEQKAIERSIDFGRLIFREGEAPPTPQEQRAMEFEALKKQNAQLEERLRELERRLLSRAVTQNYTQTSEPAVDDGGLVVSYDIPEGQKCEALTAQGNPCKKDAVIEKDGMFLCGVHARD